MRNQLVKDLEGFNCGVCPHKARLKEKGIKECWEGDGGDCDKYALEWAANRLSDLGYVKVVRCGQCKAWCLDGDQSNMVDDDGKDRRYCLISKRYMRVDDYCSKGEAKEDTNA